MTPPTRRAYTYNAFENVLMQRDIKTIYDNKSLNCALDIASCYLHVRNNVNALFMYMYKYDKQRSRAQCKPRTRPCARMFHCMILTVADPTSLVSGADEPFVIGADASTPSARCLLRGGTNALDSSLVAPSFSVNNNAFRLRF